MAKLRTNHDKKRAGESSGMIVRVGLFAILLIAAIFLLRKYSLGEQTEEKHVEVDIEDLTKYGLDSIFYLPTSTSGQVVKHRYFVFSIKEELNVPEWIAYELNIDRIKKELPDEKFEFLPDSNLLEFDGNFHGLQNSDFVQGQLIDPKSLTISDEAVEETFLFTNLAPMNQRFRDGIWQKLSEATREWTRRFNHLYVVTGPLFDNDEIHWIGEHKVAVPVAFYHILLDLKKSDQKAIAFILPNEDIVEGLESYYVSIDELELKTGIDFFPNLMPSQLEDNLEAQSNLHLWEIK